MKPPSTLLYLVLHLGLLILAGLIAVYIFYDLINHYTLIKHCDAPVNYFHCRYHLESL